MAWHFTDDVEEYASRAYPLLTADPVRHTVALTVIESSRARTRKLDPPEVFGWWETADGGIAGAISHTPPFPLLLAIVPTDAMRPLVHALDGLAQHVDAVNGDASDAAQFAAVRVNDFGGRAVLQHMMRLHRLDQLRAPAALPPGIPRPATYDDRPLLLTLVEEFAREAGVPFAAHMVDERLAYGGLTLWCNAQGQGYALAGCSRPAAGVVRIGPVYTPPQHRNRGFGSAVTHACTQAALDAGCSDVVLFTDAANPTANAIYQRLGFRAVSNSVTFQFVD